jgi:hypothetical protein
VLPGETHPQRSRFPARWIRVRRRRGCTVPLPSSPSCSSVRAQMISSTTLPSGRRNDQGGRHDRHGSRARARAAGGGHGHAKRGKTECAFRRLPPLKAAAPSAHNPAPAVPISAPTPLTGSSRSASAWGVRPSVADATQVTVTVRRPAHERIRQAGSSDAPRYSARSGQGMRMQHHRPTLSIPPPNREAEFAFPIARLAD